MKKLLLSLFIFSSLVIGGDYVSADELKCVYEYGEDIITISANDNELKASAKSGEDSINVNDNSITIENFKNSNGSLECLKTLYVEKVYSGRKLSFYKLKTLNDGYSANVKFNLNSEKSNWPEDNGEIQFINICSYDNNFIKKTEDKLLFDFPSLKFNDVTGLKYSDIPNDSCPEYIYYKCTDRTQTCEVSFKKKLGWSELRKDYDIPTSDNLNGEKSNFKTLLQALKTPAEAFDNSNINEHSILSYQLELNGNKVTLNSIEGNNNVCDMEKCSTNPTKYVESAIMDIQEYCMYIYSRDDSSETSLSECDSFTKFYNELVTDGVLRDLREGCALISSGIRDVLEKLLFLIQIAGPILAILLGSLDFIKVIFNGDPDKEFKEAFKRIKVRLIAAALLFLIPMLLSATMNLILPGQSGYDENNPFCKVD